MLSGQILTRLAFPSGYQVVFMIGFVGAILTVYQLIHVKPVADPSFPQLSVVLTPTRGPLPPLDTAGRGYLKVIGLLFLFNMTNNMLAPLIPNLLVHTLNLSDATISIGTATSSMLVFIVSLFIARLTHRTGNRRATALGAALLAVQAVVLALARDATLYLAAAVIGGIAAGILNVAQYNYHLDNVPRAEQSTWLSWNQMLGNSAVLLGALIGPAVAQIDGTPTALVFFGILRLFMGLIILKWG
jgi:MFS family permease